MFKTNDKVEDGRVRAHETAETAVVKVHEVIDKIAEQTEQGGERAQELKSAAADRAATTRENAAARAADLREQAEETKKDVAKDAKKRSKQAKKQAKSTKKQAKKSKDQKGKDAADKRDQLVETASGLAAAGAAASRKAVDEAAVRGPEVVAALRDQGDTQAALAAAKGEKPKKKRRGLKLFLLALVAGGVAFVVAKQKQAPKKDPWAVPTGDPYKAPATGRESSVPSTGTSPDAGTSSDAGLSTGSAAATGGLAATGVAPAAAAADAAPATDPLAGSSASIGEPTETADQGEAQGTDAWSSARDWADNSSVPSTTDSSEDADLHTEHLGGDLPVDGDTQA